jgi:2,3-bisphosphoglycerate-independent phosphoglycerate mutase
MRDKNGEILTNHTVGDVWCFIEAAGVKNIKNGGLNNIAPSVLKIMGLPIPPEMDEALF